MDETAAPVHPASETTPEIRYVVDCWQSAENLASLHLDDIVENGSKRIHVSALGVIYAIVAFFAAFMFSQTIAAPVMVAVAVAATVVSRLCGTEVGIVIERLTGLEHRRINLAELLAAVQGSNRPARKPQIPLTRMTASLHARMAMEPEPAQQLQTQTVAVLDSDHIRYLEQGTLYDIPYGRILDIDLAELAWPQSGPIHMTELPYPETVGGRREPVYPALIVTMGTGRFDEEPSYLVFHSALMSEDSASLKDFVNELEWRRFPKSISAHSRIRKFK